MQGDWHGTVVDKRWKMRFTVYAFRALTASELRQTVMLWRRSQGSLKAGTHYKIHTTIGLA